MGQYQPQAALALRTRVRAWSFQQERTAQRIASQSVNRNAEVTCRAVAHTFLRRTSQALLVVAEFFRHMEDLFHFEAESSTAEAVNLFMEAVEGGLCSHLRQIVIHSS